MCPAVPYASTRARAPCTSALAPNTPSRQGAVLAAGASGRWCPGGSTRARAPCTSALAPRPPPRHGCLTTRGPPAPHGHGPQTESRAQGAMSGNLVVEASAAAPYKPRRAGKLPRTQAPCGHAHCGAGWRWRPTGPSASALGRQWWGGGRRTPQGARSTAPRGTERGFLRQRNLHGATTYPGWRLACRFPQVCNRLQMLYKD